MSDLSDFVGAAYSIYRQLSRQKTSSEYSQLRAAGAQVAHVRLQTGKIRSMEFTSNLSVTVTHGQKKSSWRSSKETLCDFALLSTWKQAVERLSSKAAPGPDPRPAFVNNPKVEEQPTNLLRYDPEVARGLSPVIFHRLFQTLNPVFEAGFMADCDLTWLHGGICHNAEPMPFAWIDTNGFYFGPQTQIDESITIYHPSAPQRRRHFYQTSWRLSQIADLTPITTELKSLHKTPLLKWSPGNIDRILVTPQASAQVFNHLLAGLEANDASVELPANLELFEAPESPLFERNGLIHAKGGAIKSGVVYEAGARRAIPNKLYASDGREFSRIYCPLFCPAGLSQEETAGDYSGAALSKGHQERILVIENIELVPVYGEAARLLFPSGGVLYRDGRCLGHVAPPDGSISLESFIHHVTPTGAPIRIGGIAACALEYTP